MKMKKTIKSNANYPTCSSIKPIIFSAVAMVALSGCGNNNLSPHKVIKPKPPVHLQVDKNSTPELKEQEPTGGIPPIEPPLPPQK